MSEHDKHRQRIYNRFLQNGLAGFEEHNAMEFLLFLAHVRGDTNLLAHRLIDHFGSLANVLDAPIEDLQQIPGIGRSSAVVLKFIPQMCAYYMENKLSKNMPLDSSQAAQAFFAPKFFGKTQEEMYLAALDDRRKLLRCVRISQGTANATTVSVAQIVSEALKCNATCVIIAHNHPRGITLPSSNDIIVTREICKALRMVNIELLDHLIISDEDMHSLADTNYLHTIKENLAP